MRMADALLAQLLESTSVLNDAEATETLDSLDHGFQALQFLLYTPLEYLTKSTRSELRRRAQKADALILGGHRLKLSKESVVSLQINIRAFIARAYSYQGTSDVEVSVFASPV